MFNTFISSESKMTALPTEKFEPTEPLLGMVTAVADWFNNTLRVEPGVNSLSKAVEKARKERYTKILLLNGVHDEKGEQVVIDFPLTIIGESKDGCIVLGGLGIRGKKEDDVNVSNLTLRGSTGYGVLGYNCASMHLDNVSVENSGTIGVFVFGTKRNTMKNCNVSHSKTSGLVVSHGGLMIISGKDTTIHNNCTNGGGSIHLVSPLTIEAISTDNGGGGNVGGTGYN